MEDSLEIFLHTLQTTFDKKKNFSITATRKHLIEIFLDYINAIACGSLSDQQLANIEQKLNYVLQDLENKYGKFS